MRRCHEDHSNPNVCVQEGSIAWSICNCEIARKNHMLHMHHKSIFRHTQVDVRDVLISLTKLVCVNFITTLIAVGIQSSWMVSNSSVLVMQNTAATFCGYTGIQTNKQTNKQDCFLAQSLKHGTAES